MAVPHEHERAVRRYHEATKHRIRRFARSLGYMDWATQPDPFLRFPAAPVTPMPVPSPDDARAWPDLTWVGLPQAPLTAASVSRLFWTSLALSAWKQVSGPDGHVAARWSLRVNPSSGNLHPTESWLACGGVPELVERPSLHHYRADSHALERCATITPAIWDATVGSGRLLFGLSSIPWREAWKYGERAFRYCNHDVGHALAAVDLAAAALGWRVRLRDDLPSAVVGAFLGCDDRSGPEQDHPDALLEIVTDAALDAAPLPLADLLTAVRDRAGRPVPLSPSHNRWEAIETAIAATAWPGITWPPLPGTPLRPAATTAERSFGVLVRRRRSAVDMDGSTGIDRAGFFDLLDFLMPDRRPRPFGLLPWTPEVSLVLFVHRVDGLDSGLYVLVRDPSHEAGLRAACKAEPTWEQEDGCPAGLPFFRLRRGDLRARARDIACRQDIAADGAFTVAMLARFDDSLTRHGPGMYPRLYWETGVVGQMLYLAAEAAGLQGTGIGCFFDDEMHDLLGITDSSWQSLYHFTVGRGVDDPRIQSVAAYDHLPE